MGQMKQLYQVILIFGVAGLMLLPVALAASAPQFGAPTVSQARTLIIENVGQYPAEVRFVIQKDADHFSVRSDGFWRESGPVAEKLSAFDIHASLKFFVGEPHKTRVTYMADGQFFNDVPTWQSLQVLDYSGQELLAIDDNSTAWEGISQRSPNALSRVTIDLNAGSVSSAYGTFVGTSTFDQGRGIAIGAVGSAYIVVDSDSTSIFPDAAGRVPLHVTQGIVAKLSPDGSSLEYIVNVLGTDEQFLSGIDVDSSGAAYVTGITLSDNFTTTLGAFDREAPTGSEFKGFLIKIEPDGSAISYSTFLGGSAADEPSDLIVDELGQVYIVGFTHSDDFPTTPGAYDITHNGSPGKDGFLTVLNPAGWGQAALLYSTFLGGSVDDNAAAISLDSNGDVCVSGSTSSSDMPATKTLGALGSSDVFVTKLSRVGCGLDDLIYTIVLGGSGYDSGEGLAVLDNGAALIAGSASAGFPGAGGHAGGLDGLLFKLNAAGTNINWTTMLGGAGADFLWDLSLERSGLVLAAGLTLSADLPVTDGSSLSGGQDVLIGQLGSGGSIDFLGYHGGNAADYALDLAAYGLDQFMLIGGTISGNYPTTSGSYDESHNGDFDAMVSFLQLDSPVAPTPVPSPTPSATPDPAQPPRLWLPITQRACEGSTP